MAEPQFISNGPGAEVLPPRESGPCHDRSVPKGAQLPFADPSPCRPASIPAPTYPGFLREIRQSCACASLALAMVLAAMAPATILAQDKLPRTDIYLFDLESGPEGMELLRPRALTADWGAGYHNHPWFAGEHHLLVSSDARHSGKPDIWELDLQRGTRRRISSGPKAWFSPRYRPGSDRVTAISLAPEGPQYMENFTPGTGFRCEVLVPDEPRAGYYAWKDSFQVAVFVVGEPHELWLADLRTSVRQRIALHPGRQLVFDDRGILHYVQKVAPEAWYLKTWDPVSRQESMITRMVEGSEDFCLLPDGTYLMTSGSKIWKFNPRHDLRWQPLADLSVYGLHHLTRISQFEGRRLALVNQWP